jgi:hypothetical protein
LLEFESLASELQKMAVRLPGHGQFRMHSVGEANDLRGKAYYLDFPTQRLLVLVTGLGSKQMWLAYTLCAHPLESYYLPSRSGLDQRMTMNWARELSELEAELRKFPGRPDPVRPPTGPGLPPEFREVISVALSGRLRAWNLEAVHLYAQVAGALNCDMASLRLWWPQLQSNFRSARPNYRLDPDLVKLPQPIILHNPGFDALDLYAQAPKAHGILYLGPPHLSSDGNQCLLPLNHSLGISQSDFWRRPLDPDQIVEFQEVLFLEKQGPEWRLRGSLPAYVGPPPALVQAKEKERLQKELGNWGTVLSLEVENERATEARILTPLGPRRVISAQAFSHPLERGPEAPAVIIKEPTLWINDHNLSGEAIRLAQAPGPEATDSTGGPGP